MSKMTPILATIFLASLLVAGCGLLGNAPPGDRRSGDGDGTPVTPPSEETYEDLQETLRRSDSQGGVIVDVLWISPELLRESNADEGYAVDEYLVFQVDMTTHSGDLRDYSYLDNTAMIIGEREIRLAREDILSNDSHHPRVLIKFPLRDEHGDEYVNDEVETVHLVLRDLRDVPERLFTWNLAP